MKDLTEGSQVDHSSVEGDCLAAKDADNADEASVCADNTMSDEEQRAYEWALNQNYQSVAARYARTLALFIANQNKTGA